MANHQPVLPARAIELVKSRNLDAADILLADFAAAGLIKTYALVREIRPVGGPTRTIRDTQIPPEEWDRIVTTGNVGVALNGGTVRLEGSPLNGGIPTVLITGVSFSETSLVKVLDRYCAQAPVTHGTTLSKSNCQMEAKTPASSFQNGGTSKKAVPPIKQGDLTASVAQTMQATSLGRTKIDRLMRDGKLVRRKVGNRTLITVESIERLVGTKVGREQSADSAEVGNAAECYDDQTTMD